MVINSWMKCGYLAKESWCSGPKAEAGFINQRYFFTAEKKSAGPSDENDGWQWYWNWYWFQWWYDDDDDDDVDDYDDDDAGDKSTFPGNNRICRRRGRSQSDNQGLPRHSSWSSSTSSSS